MNKRVQRSLIVGGLAIAAAVVPAFVGDNERVQAQCLSAFGSLTGGVCLDQPGGGGSPGASSPSVGIGPTGNGGGPGISTSPLFPGQTFNVPLGP
ncbi:DUF7155 family protein [Mycobacterium sp.]|uniref:DUF7155 family protein n=1 Tax=Mycobacterium sp. TaxID=1785 RepID=UPI002BB6FE44|nr:hypothetical protein [Mycobacterium sp.]HME47420.1 hypothetical protein [Mycobacterium sp.]